MPIMQKQNTWFRIAANPKGIKEGLPHYWRCFILPENNVFTLKSYSVVGLASQDNFIPGSTDEEGIDPRAWIAMFGDIVINEDGKAIFTLKKP